MCCKIVEAQSCTSVCFSKCCLTMTLRPSSLLRLGWRALWQSMPTRAWLHFSTPPFWTSMIKMRRADYKVPSHCSLFWSTALFPGGKLSPNVGEELQSWKGSARYLDLDYPPSPRCWEQNIEIMIPHKCITTILIHLIMTSTANPQSFPLYRRHCCFLLWFYRLW